MATKPENYENIRELIANAIKDSELKGGVRSIGKDIFEANLPEGITPAATKELATYVKTFSAAAIEASGECLASDFKSDKKLDQVTVELDLGHVGDFSFRALRTDEINVPGKKGEPSTRREVVGSIYPKLSFNSGKGSALMEEARQTASSLIQAALKK